jgi:hypothetical protein
METKNFVELPRDEFNNRAFTPGDNALVIRARVEPGKGEPGTFGGLATLHVLEPKNWVWPTLLELHWKEVDHPPGIISDKVWRELVGLPAKE